MTWKRVLDYLHKILINVGSIYKIKLIMGNQLSRLKTALSYFYTYSTTGLRIDDWEPLRIL